MTREEKEKYQENLRLIRATLDNTQFDYGWLAKFFLLFGIASLVERALTMAVLFLPIFEKALALNCKNIFGIVKVLVVVVGYILIRYKIVATQSAHTMQLYRLWGFGIFTPWYLNIFYNIVNGIVGKAYHFTNTSNGIILLTIEFFGLFLFLSVFLCTALMTSNSNMLYGATFTIFLVFAVILWQLISIRTSTIEAFGYEGVVVSKLYTLLYVASEFLTSIISIVIGITFQLKRRKNDGRI